MMLAHSSDITVTPSRAVRATKKAKPESPSRAMF